MATPKRKEDRKSTIFAAAVQCFNELGYYKTSMDLIAQRAGITKRGLYYHFTSKDKLFIQLFHHMNDLYFEQLPARAMAVADPEQRLKSFAKIANEMLQQNTAFLKFALEFMSMSVRKPQIRAVMSAYYREQVEKVTRTIREGAASGVFAPVDADKAARAIVLLTMGAFYVYFSLEGDYSLPDQHMFDIDLLLKGLKQQKP